MYNECLIVINLVDRTVVKTVAPAQSQHNNNQMFHCDDTGVENDLKQCVGYSVKKLRHAKQLNLIHLIIFKVGIIWT